MITNIECEITVPRTIKQLCLYPVTVCDKKYLLFVAIDPDKNRQYEMVKSGSFDYQKYRIKLKTPSKWAKAKAIVVEYYGYILAAAGFLWMAMQ